MKVYSLSIPFMSLLTFVWGLTGVVHDVLAGGDGRGAGDGGGLNPACWMAQYQADLSNIALSNLVILGSHDADSAFVNATSPPCIGYETSEKHTISAHPSAGDLNVARCQSASISNQLCAGVRWLDMRVAYQGGAYFSEHMWLAGPFMTTNGVLGIFDELLQFLNAHTNEIIIINTQSVHIYSDTTSSGLATAGELNAFFQQVKDALPLVPAPTNDPLQTTLGSIWSGPGRVIYIGPDNLNTQLQPYVWGKLSVDSTWYSNAYDVGTLMTDLTANMETWYAGPYNDQFHVLQAMANDTNKIYTARFEVNPAILDALCNTLPDPEADRSWKQAPLNVVQMNDSVNADGCYASATGTSLMITALLTRMGITNSQKAFVSRRPVAGDYDGDGTTDPAIYVWTNLANGRLHGWLSSAAYAHIESAASFQVDLGETPAFADFDGDRYTDLAVFRRTEGTWTFWLSAAGYGQVGPIRFGVDANDIPVPADYDGDRKADPAVYHAGEGTWTFWLSAAGYAQTGPLTPFHADRADIPAAGDYDGDGRADPALYASDDGAWYFWLSGNGYALVGPVAFKTGGAHIAAPADYDGDGKCDPAVYAPSSDKWRVWGSESGYRLMEVKLP